MRDVKGYLTVFLTLTLSIMFSLCLTVIEGVRQNTIRLEAECVADIGINSVLAEYHRELLAQYDLFFIDTSYGTAIPDYRNTAEHLETYMNYNFGVDRWLLPFVCIDYVRLCTKEVLITEVSSATDDNGKVLRRQAVDYMRHKTGLSIVKDVQEWMQVVSSESLLDMKIEEEREEIERQLAQWGEESAEIDNPADWVSHTRSNGILELVTEGELSQAAIDTVNCVSARNCNKGTGINPEVSYDESIWEKLLFQEYIMEKTGRYGEEKQDSRLKYQTEYILEGKASDTDNLKGIIYRLLALREAANTIYLYGDADKKALAEAAATILASICAVPEAAPLLETLLILTWACAESMYDIKVLLSGGRIPLIKQEADWHYDLENALVLGSKEEKAEKKGLRYEDYLRLFLGFQDIEQNTYRLMDIIETDIRQTAGNTMFRIDGCIDSLKVFLTVESKYGYEYNVVSRFGY